LDPAFNRHVIAVGGMDETAGNILGFSNAGSGPASLRMPDVVAPGLSILGLHAVGSAADDEILATCEQVTRGYNDQNGDPHAPADWTSPVAGPGGRFVHGTGTSQAAAIVSGAVALLLSQRGGYLPSDGMTTPDYIKALLRKTATTLKDWTGTAYPQGEQGQGLVNLSAASLFVPASYDQMGATFALNTMQPLDYSRGLEYLVDFTSPDVDGVPGGCNWVRQSPAPWLYPWLCPSMKVLRGNVDIFGTALDVTGLERAEATRTAWVTSADGTTETWFGTGLTLGTSFTPDANLAASCVSDPSACSHDPLQGRSWSGRSWSGRRWSASGMQGRSWSDLSWSGRSWSGRSWSHTVWADNDWS
jgi:serine protease AprX